MGAAAQELRRHGAGLYAESAAGDAILSDAVQQGYDDWAASYDAVVNPTRDLDAEVLRQVMEGRVGGRVLELGCGTGKNTGWLAARAARLIACDFSAAMLARAKERVSGVEFHLGDIRRDWPVDEVDVIVIDLVLEHIEDLAPVFAQAREKLAVGGLFFVCEFHPFKQYAGKQARYAGADGVEVEIPAYMHHLSDYLEAARGERLELIRLDEWWVPDGREAGKTPQLLSLLWSNQ